METTIILSRSHLQDCSYRCPRNQDLALQRFARQTSKGQSVGMIGNLSGFLNVSAV